MKMKTSTKFVAVPLMALTLLSSGAGFTLNNAIAFGGVGKAVSPIINPATGFPLWYQDTTDVGGTRLQLCLGTGANGVGAVDPNCVLPGQPTPIDPVTAALTNFPVASFYGFAEAPLLINGLDARFRLFTEAGFVTDPAVIDGQQNMLARASLFTNQQGAFPVSSSFHVVYPFGSFDFSTDAIGDFVASNPNPLIAPFQVGGGGKEMRAEDGPGAALDFATVLGVNNTGMTRFLKSTTAPVGYLGLGDATVTPGPVTGGTNGNAVVITQTAGVGPFVVTGGADWIVAGKVAPSTVAFTTQPSATVFVAAPLATQPVVALQGNGVTLPTATDNVTLGAFTDSLCTIAAPVGTLTGTTTQAAVAGVATFAGIAVSAPGTFFLGANSPTIPTTCAAAATVVAPAAPVAVADNLTTTVDTDLVIPATNLIANDTAGSVPPVTVLSVQAPTNGTVSLVGGTITFTPTPGFIGTATFTYTIGDAGVGVAQQTATATVTVGVQPPSAPAHRFRSIADGRYLFTADVDEINNIITNLGASWVDEGTSFKVATAGAVGATPAHRFRSLQDGRYLFTANIDEINNIIANLSASWVDEGTAFSIFAAPQTFPTAAAHRFRNLVDGRYIITSDINEINSIITSLSATWTDEGTTFNLPL